MQLQIPMTAAEPWGNRARSRRMRRYAQKSFFFFFGKSRRDQRDKRYRINKRPTSLELNHPRDVTSLVVPLRLLEREMRSPRRGFFTRCVHPLVFRSFVPNPKDVMAKQEATGLKYERRTEGSQGWEDNVRIS